MLEHPDTDRVRAPSVTRFEELEPHLKALDAFLREQVAQFEPEITDLAGYCLESTGKRIRPALVFFSGWTKAGAVDESLVRVAAIIEMVHLATLVHDDIMDGADLRRQKITASRKFGAEVAVLLGDALFSHALTLAASFPTTEVCYRVATATRRVCTGEIMQTLAAGSEQREIAAYQRIIDLKTAELFSVSCFLGSKLATGDAAYAEAAASFGRHLGIAYQMYDDLADYFGDEDDIGKTLGTDLASRKATLPFILLLERLPAPDGASARHELATGDLTQWERRVSQMCELGVFRDISNGIADEIRAGMEPLRAWSRHPGVGKLQGLVSMLDARVDALRPR